MPDAVLMLEDDRDRVARFALHLPRLLPTCELVTFDRSVEAVAWLEDRQADAVLVALDHDLPLWHDLDGNPDDFGTGREVADWLAGREPTCPVVVHTSNDAAGTGMVAALRRAFWPVWRVRGRGDCDWIDAEWAPLVTWLIAEGWVVPTSVGRRP